VQDLVRERDKMAKMKDASEKAVAKFELELASLRQDRLRVLKTLNEKQEQHRAVLQKKQDLIEDLRKRTSAKERELARVTTAKAKSNSALRQRNALLESRVRMLREQQHRRVRAQSESSANGAGFESALDGLQEAAAQREMQEVQREQIEQELAELVARNETISAQVSAMEKERSALNDGQQWRRLDDARYQKRMDWSLQDAVDTMDSLKAQIEDKKHHLKSLEGERESLPPIPEQLRAEDATEAIVARLLDEGRLRRRAERRGTLLAETLQEQQQLLAESKRALTRQQSQYDKHVLEISGIHNGHKELLLQELDDLSAALQERPARRRPAAEESVGLDDPPRGREPSVIRRPPSPCASISTAATEREVKRRTSVFHRLQRDSSRREKALTMPAKTDPQSDAAFSEVFMAQLRDQQGAKEQWKDRRTKAAEPQTLYATQEEPLYEAVATVEAVHGAAPAAAALSKTTMFTAAADALKSWDLEAGVNEVASASLVGRRNVRSLAARGSLVATCGGQVRLFDARTLKPASVVDEVGTAVTFVAEGLAVAGRDEDAAFLRVYDLRRLAEPVLRLDAGGKAAEPVVLEAAYPEKGLLLGSIDKKVRAWVGDLRQDQTPRVLTPPHYDQLTAICGAETEVGRIVLTTSKDRHVRAWTLPARAQAAAHVQALAHHDSVTGVAFISRPQHAVTAARDGFMRFWSLGSEKLELEPTAGYLARHSSAPVAAVCAGPDFFVSLSQDKSMKLWRERECSET
jgi:hypothetical protein